MSTTTIRGSLTPFLQSWEKDFDPQRGFVYREYYKGLSLAQMEGLQNFYIASGISCRLMYSNGIATLEMEDTTQQYTIDTWQILGNELSIDGFSHPTIIAGVSDTQVAKMRSFLDDSATPDVAFADSSLSSLGAFAKRFYSLNQRGSPEFRKSQYVLSHETNAPNRWAANISDVGVDQVYTPAQLVSEAQNSSFWAVPLPGRLAYKILNIPTPTFQANYLWGWLKGGSTETTAANNRISIRTEYILYQFSTDYYFSH